MTLLPRSGILLKVMRERYIDTSLTYTEVYEPNHLYIFSGPCLVTGEDYSVTVKGEELHEMRRKDSIMALRSLSAEDREFLISGTSPKGWKKLFSFEESD